jgi:hypothetical protein
VARSAGEIKNMAFKIKDLMINIAPSELGNDPANCVAGKKSDIGDSPDIERNIQFCPGRRTDIFCGVVVTDVGGCPGKHTDMGCPGKHTDIGGCTGRHTDVVICVGRHTDIAVCVGRHTDVAGCPETTTRMHCGKCTVKSPKQILSPACDPGEMLEELNIIKAQLRAELAGVDEEIREIEDTLQPKTIGEVEELQTKLQEALEELGKIKADLEKK